jgi:hypothetical protein
VDDLLRFLAGDERVMLDRLQAQRVALQGRGYSTKAAQLEQAQRAIAAVAREGALITSALHTDDLILVLPAVEDDAVEALLLTRGRLWARTHVERDESAEAVAERLRRAWTRAHESILPPIDHETIDETALITSWLRRHEEDLTIFRLPTADTADAWQTLAAAILLADPEREEWEAPEVETVEDEEAFADDEESWEDEDADEVILLG